MRLPSPVTPAVLLILFPSLSKSNRRRASRYPHGMSAQVSLPQDDVRFPVGKFEKPAGPISNDMLSEALRTLAECPEQLRNAVEGLSDPQLATPYREGGWNVRQVVHHMADSHLQAAGRMRLALTEDWPAVLAYNEKAWAELHDSKAAPVEWSLEIIESLHARWVMLLQSLTPEQWPRGYVHSVYGRSTIAEATLLYAWHSRHHVAHITHLRAARGW